MLILRQTTQTKKDLLNIPFEDIDSNFKASFSVAKAKALEKLNSRHKERFDWAVSREFPESESVDDNKPEFIPKDELTAEEIQSLQLRVHKEVIEEFVAKHNIAESWKYLGPQLLAHLATYKVPSTHEGCKIDATEFLNKNVLGRPRELGIYRMLTKVPRSVLMKGQTSPEHLNCCSLVPVHMAAQKKYNDIPYESWNKSSCAALMDKDLFAAATVVIDDERKRQLSPDQLLLIRDHGLNAIFKGKPVRRNPRTYHMLVNIKDTLIGDLPRYTQAMLTQIWCAHPENRNSLMILDPSNWDHMPLPLIPTSPLIPEKTIPQYDADFAAW